MGKSYFWASKFLYGSKLVSIKCCDLTIKDLLACYFNFLTHLLWVRNILGMPLKVGSMHIFTVETHDNKHWIWTKMSPLYSKQLHILKIKKMSFHYSSTFQHIKKNIHNFEPQLSTLAGQYTKLGHNAIICSLYQ